MRVCYRAPNCQRGVRSELNSVAPFLHRLPKGSRIHQGRWAALCPHRGAASGVAPRLASLSSGQSAGTILAWCSSYRRPGFVAYCFAPSWAGRHDRDWVYHADLHHCCGKPSRNDVEFSPGLDASAASHNLAMARICLGRRSGFDRSLLSHPRASSRRHLGHPVLALPGFDLSIADGLAGVFRRAKPDHAARREHRRSSWDAVRFGAEKRQQSR